MRKVLVAVVMALMLSGCMSMLDSAYDTQAQRECDQGRASDRGPCYDRVDQHRRDRSD